MNDGINTTRPNPSLGQVRVRPAIELWFFRDLTDEQRYKLAVLCGLPGEAWPASQHAQRLFLRTILSALDLSPPVVEEGAWRYDLDAVPRDRDFLIQYDHKEVTLGHYLDNSKTQWPYEGIRPCRSMRPERVSEKIIAWRELPSTDTAGSSDLAAASPNGEHLRPLADREKSAASPVPEPQAVAWTNAEALDLMSYRGADTPYEAPMWSEPTPDHDIALFAAAPLSGGGKVDRAAVIEECAREIDLILEALHQQRETIDISREYAAYGIAARAVRALSTMGGKP